MKLSTFFQREYLDIHAEIQSELRKILLSGTYILGSEVEKFESEFASYLGAKYVIGVGNGMEALEIGMMACGIGKGDEILTTPLSAVASTLAITSLGAKPVFIDIDPFFHIDPALIEKKITKKTKAILPVHLYGQATDMEFLGRIARKYHIAIFEDACQAHGATYKNKKLGTIGIFGAFSFYPTKNLGCYGDGGAIVTNDMKIAEKCRMLRNYGQKNRYIHAFQGLNSRLDEIQAAILHVKLPHLDAWNTKRRTIAKLYTKALEGVGDIETPKERKDYIHIYHQYVIRTKKRDALLAYLHAHSILALIHYPVPIHKQPCYKEFHTVRLPNVEKACKEIISLPIHPSMSDREAYGIVNQIKHFYS